MNWKKFIRVIIAIVIIYSIGIVWVTSHEAIHYVIFARYGIRSEVDFNFFPIIRGKVTPIEGYKNCNDSCKLQHTLNDIIGYNLIVFMAFLVFLEYIKRITKNENKIH